MSRHIRVTLDIRTDLTPRETGEYLQVLIDEGTAFHVDVTALHAKEVKPMGRAPISEDQKCQVISLRRGGECPECGSVQRAYKRGGACDSAWHNPTYEAIASATDLSRASVIKICKAENA